MAETTTELRPAPDVIETAAEWTLMQPGWIDRVLQTHTECGFARGCCAGCGTYRLVKWPCVLVTIAQRALRMMPEVVPLHEAA